MRDILAPFQILYVARFIRENKIDIIHAHQRLPVFIGCMAGKMAGIPVVVTVHGQTQYDVRSPLTRKWIDRFIFVRQSTLDEAAGLWNPPGKVAFYPEWSKNSHYSWIKEIIIHYVTSAVSIRDIPLSSQ